MKRRVARRGPRNILIALCTAAAAVLWSTPASAQATQPGSAAGPVEPGHWTVSPYVMFPFAGDLEGATTGIGVAGGYNWNSRIGLEADLAVVPTVTQGVLVNFDSSTWNLTGNVLYHFRAQRDKWTPFVVGGIGIGHGSTDLVANDPLLQQFGANDSTTGLVTNVGGGLKYYLNNRFGLRGDLRYYTGHDLIPDHVRLSFGLGVDLGTRVP
jgi:opacity protein-like surface antigen